MSDEPIQAQAPAPVATLPVVEKPVTPVAAPVTPKAVVSPATSTPASQPFAFDDIDLDNTVNPTGSLHFGKPAQNGPDYAAETIFINMTAHAFPHHWWDLAHETQFSNVAMIAEDGFIHIAVNNGQGNQELSRPVPFQFEPNVPHHLCFSLTDTTATLEDMDKGVVLIAFTPQTVSIPKTGKNVTYYVGANQFMCYKNGKGTPGAAS